jgi:hypothetical protein
MKMLQSKIERRPGHSARVAGLGLAVFVGLASSALAQISLGTAGSFGVLAGSTVTNTGATVVTGNLGVSPGTAVIGFPPGTVTPPGTIHSADAVASQAKADLVTAYDAIVATPTLVDLTGTDLGGITLTPGVYGFSSSAQLTGTLTLDALGNANSVFIFKIGSTLTTASNSSVIVINGGSNCNVFWQVGSSVTLGTGTVFVGNILALTSATLTTGATVSGRVLARNGAVTLDSNAVTVCLSGPICPIVTLAPSTLPDGVVGTAYSQTMTASGGTGPYTFAVSSGSLPPPLAIGLNTGSITGTPTTAGTYAFTITATDANGCPGSRPYTVSIAANGCSVILLNPATLPSGVLGTPYSSGVTASGGTAPYTYAITSGALPTGLSPDTSTGAITGTPTAAGIFTFTITATDNGNCPGRRSYTISIAACPPIVLSPATLPAGVRGIPYLQTVSASGGTGPYVYSYSGTLPSGLSLDAATGDIAGTPTATGVFAFVITATDANQCTALLGYSVAIGLNTAVPTLSGWGLWILGALVALGGVLYLRVL